MKMTPQMLKKRYDSAWSKKENWRSLYEQCYTYGLPQRNLYDGYHEDGAGGRHKGSIVFDSTAVLVFRSLLTGYNPACFPLTKDGWISSPVLMSLLNTSLCFEKTYSNTPISFSLF